MFILDLPVNRCGYRGLRLFRGQRRHSSGTQHLGQHVWKAGDSSTTLNWQTSIGYSKRTFSAQADFKLNSTSKSGRNFSVDGNLKLQQPIGGELSLDFTLKGSYQWNNNLLTFQADVSDVGGALTYDLMLEGSFKLDHGTIKFDVKFSNAAAVNSFTLDLNIQGDKTSLIKALSVHCRSLKPRRAR